MEWLFTSIVATLAGTLVLSSVYFFLYKSDQQKFLLIWGAGWLVSAARFVFMLLVVNGVYPKKNPSFFIVTPKFSG